VGVLTSGPPRYSCTAMRPWFSARAHYAHIGVILFELALPLRCARSSTISLAGRWEGSLGNFPRTWIAHSDQGVRADRATIHH